MSNFQNVGKYVSIHIIILKIRLEFIQNLNFGYGRTGWGTNFVPHPVLAPIGIGSLNRFRLSLAILLIYNVVKWYINYSIYPHWAKMS